MFHGISTNQVAVALDGSEAPARILVTSLLAAEKLVPSACLDKALHLFPELFLLEIIMPIFNFYCFSYLHRAKIISIREPWNILVFFAAEVLSTRTENQKNFRLLKYESSITFFFLKMLFLIPRRMIC